MDLFSTLLKSATEQVNKLGKRTEVVDSVASLSSTADESLPHSDDPNAAVEEREPSTSQAVPVFISNGSEAITTAKNIGALVSESAVNFGYSVMKNARQLATSVQSLAIVQELQQELLSENEETVSETDDIECAQLLPWSGMGTQEAEVKAKILALATDRRNFVRGPPAGVQFAFDLNQSTSMAMALLEEDAPLQVMRYQLVPKVIDEETFWRNYFYRISLIKQGAVLDDTNEKIEAESTAKKSNSNVTKALPDEAELAKELEEFECIENLDISEEEINLELFNCK